jgi:hydroxypyruvate reductase/glycerate 2-kinase
VTAADPTPAAAPPRSGPRIELLESLAERGMSDARRAALRIASAGLAACDVHGATHRVVSLEGDDLVIDGVRHRLDPAGRVLVIGAGKASLGIATALEEILGERLTGGAIAVRSGQQGELERIDVLDADHPLPSAASESAARRLLEIATGAGERDIILACFTGGSSALASLAPAGVSAEEKRALHEVLLASGVGIVEVNTVRKHVSAFKGGRLAHAALPAALVNLTVSDGAGDHLDAITDPSVPDTTTAADAIAVLRGHGLWDRVPDSVRAHLGTDEAESPDLGDAERIQTVLLVTGTSACDAMAVAAAELGRKPVVVSTTLEGEARQIGKTLANLARHSAADGSPFAGGTAMLGCGGECTVTLGAGAAFGAGGPNQEAALAAALELEGTAVAAVFLDTDGSDGGTEHAGAIVDGLTVERAAAAGLDLRAALLEHTSVATLAALEDALVTGPTGTNVNDMFAIVIEPIGERR